MECSFILLLSWAAAGVVTVHNCSPSKSVFGSIQKAFTIDSKNGEWWIQQRQSLTTPFQRESAETLD